MKALRLFVVVVVGLQLNLLFPSTLSASPVSESGTCSVDDSGGADYTRIQDAIDDALCETIEIAAGDYEESLEIARDVTLVGAGADVTSLSHSVTTGRAINVSSESAAVDISGMAVTAVYVTGDGGCISNAGDLTLIDVTVSGCQATGNGGGIYNSGTLALDGCTVAGNFADYGGGIYHAASSIYDSLTVSGSTIAYNSVTSYGGGIYNGQYRTALIEDSVIQENYAEYGGGGISNANFADLDLSGSHILSNTVSTSSGNGGGIWNNGALTVTGSLAAGNAAFEGGGIFLSSWGTLTLDDSSLHNNTALSGGGGIYGGSSGSMYPVINISGSEISANTATSGGAIRSFGDLLVTNSAVMNNTASSFGGGIDSRHLLTMTLSWVTGNASDQDGGGLYASGEGLVLRDVTLRENSAARSGGGIYADETASLERVTLSANTAGKRGGGIYQSGAMTLTNCTLSGNAAAEDGGGIYNDAVLILNSLTLAYNTADSDADATGDGGGIYHTGSPNPVVHNTLIAGNADASPVTVHPDCSGVFTSLGYNLIGDNSGCTGFATVYDQVGTAAAPLAAYLLPLADYGGDTETHGLTYSVRVKSPAVDGGPTTGCLATDQRGEPRPYDRDGDGTAACDIGAYEAQAVIVEEADLQVTQTSAPAIAATGENITLTLTLKNAGPYDATGVEVSVALPPQLAYVSALGSGVVITAVTGSHYVWDVQDLAPEAQGSIQILATVSGAATGGTVLTTTASIAGDQGDSVPGNNISAGSVTVGRCFATPDDGATVYRSVDAQALRDAIAAATGATVKVAGLCAGVGSEDAVAYLAGSVLPGSAITLRGGYAADDWTTPNPARPAVLDAEGGGIVMSVVSATVELEYLQLTGGYTSRWGAGFYAEYSTVAMNNVAITGNTADMYAGGVCATFSDVTMHHSEVLSNTAATSSGLYSANGEIALDDVEVAHNATTTTSGLAGGVNLTDSSGVFTDTWIHDNTASYAAGGLYVGSGSTLTMTRGAINANDGSKGAGIFSLGGLNLVAVTVSDNVATTGGGLYVGSGEADLSRVVVSDNTASGGSGGGLYIDASTVILDRAAVVSNTTTLRGGALCNLNGTVSLVNTTLSQNAATSGGGAIYHNSSVPMGLTFVTVAGNSTGGSGGALYLAVDEGVVMTNTLLAGNTPDTCYANDPASLGYNLADDTSCDLTGAGDQEGVDPLLDALQDNGGGTLTHALLSGSPAANAGLCIAGITTDQRGSPRPGPNSPACDIGAFEAATAADPADVAVSKSVTPATAAPGDAITYTLHFTNTGGTTAVRVFITDTLPISLTHPAYSYSGATITKLAGDPYVWRVANLAAGAGGIITITGDVREPLAAGSFDNTATIAALIDDDTGNNSDTVQVSVPNVAPWAQDVTAPAVHEAAVLTGALAAHDANGDALSYAITTPPVWGSVALDAGGYYVYTPTNRTASYADTFTWIVTDTGSLSASATVTVPVLAADDPPEISNIRNQATTVDVPVGPIPFVINDADTPIPSLSLQKASSNTTLVPLANIVFGGGGKNRTVTVTPGAGQSGTAVITVTVSDGTGVASDAFVLLVGAGNSAPEIVSAPVKAATEDVAYAYHVVAADLDVGDTLTLTALTKPAWLTLIDHHNRTATLGGTPRNADVGAHAVTLQVVDNHGASATQIFTVTVANTNDAPVAQHDTAATNESTPLLVNVTANDTDPDGDGLILAAVGAPSYGSTVMTGNSITYTPTNRTASYPAVFTYTVSDGALSASATVTVVVSAANDSPEISEIAGLSIHQDESAGPVPFTVSDADTPVAALTLIKATSNPTLVPLANIVFGGSDAARTVTVTPAAGKAGSAAITVTVGDGATSDATSFLLDVIANQPPVFASTPITVALEDAYYLYDVFAIDLEDGEAGRPLVLSAVLKPAWLAFTDNGNSTGALSGTPGQAQVGAHPVTLRAVDASGAVTTQAFTLNVVNVNDAPVANDDVAATNETTPRTIPVLSNDYDVDGDTLTLVAAGAPVDGALAIDGSTLVYQPVQRTATYTEVVTYTISDGALSRTAKVTIIVAATDAPPTISNIRNLHTEINTPVGPVAFQVHDLDTALDTLMLGKLSSNPALVAPAAIVFGGSGAARTVTVTPTLGVSGTALITITVSDAASMVSDGFVLAVAANAPPEFVSSPVADAIEGRLYAYSAVAVDADPAEVLTITAQLAPDWLEVEPIASGRAVLRGVPPDSAVGVHVVELLVSDIGGATATQAYTLTVHARNQRPWAQAGADQTVSLGAFVTLDGSASNDPDAGDTLTYGWIQAGGPAVTLSDPTAVAPTFTAPLVETVLTFTLVVTDNLGVVSPPDTVAVTVDNQSPVADAGPDQTVDALAVVTLDGSASNDPDGHLPLAYSWVQASGPAVVLSDPALVSPTFTAPDAVAALVFTLVVTDGYGEPSLPDTVTIMVEGSDDHMVYLPLVFRQS